MSTQALAKSIYDNSPAALEQYPYIKRMALDVKPTPSLSRPQSITQIPLATDYPPHASTSSRIDAQSSSQFPARMAAPVYPSTNPASQSTYRSALLYPVVPSTPTSSRNRPSYLERTPRTPSRTRFQRTPSKQRYHPYSPPQTRLREDRQAQDRRARSPSLESVMSTDSEECMEAIARADAEWDEAVRALNEEPVQRQGLFWRILDAVMHAVRG